jgi:methionyl aminopeptidase
MNKVTIKTEEEIEIMRQGGTKLHEIKMELVKRIKGGVRASEIEELAVSLIKHCGGKPSFMMVPGYHWATCINVNCGVVHGIPTSDVIFRKGDIVSIDIGLLYQGFNTDTSISVGINLDSEKERFIKTGQDTIAKVIKEVKIGNYIYDISYMISNVIEKAGYSPIRDLVGHGVGKNLHEDPAIPCIIRGPRLSTVKIQEGMTLAIEIMYTRGAPDLVKAKDGWTIATRDGKISALFEETVAVTRHGPLILT